jgi:hypothetical protein
VGCGVCRVRRHGGRGDLASRPGIIGYKGRESMSLSFRKRGLVVGLIIFAILLLLINHFRTIPQAPVFPESTLNDQNVYIHNDFWKPAMPNTVRLYYSALELPERIINYYQERGALCQEFSFDGSQGVTCEGKANPFGSYSAYIYPATYVSNGYTEFTIEIEWEWFIQI